MPEVSLKNGAHSTIELLQPTNTLYKRLLRRLHPNIQVSTIGLISAVVEANLDKQT